MLCLRRRNNTSDYYVNGRKASAKDVATLLSSKGIDLDNNRFLILQVGLEGAGGGGWRGGGRLNGDGGDGRWKQSPMPRVWSA